MSDSYLTCTTCGGRGWTGTPDKRKKCTGCKNGWIYLEHRKPKPPKRDKEEQPATP